MNFASSDNSIIKKIWGKTDITLFIFAGAAAEFALNKEVDWLYFTGKLPADPIGRLFSTVSYSQKIIFSDGPQALNAVDKINSIHRAVESTRTRSIPAAAYKDVLFMLVHYSIASFELLERNLTVEEKNEIVEMFSAIGTRMHLQELPTSYAGWQSMYAFHQKNNLEYSPYTKDLFRRYRVHLGLLRYWLLKEIQRAVVPPAVNSLLHLGPPLWIRIVLPIYRLVKKLRLDMIVIQSMVPRRYNQQLSQMQVMNG